MTLLRHLLGLLRSSGVRKALGLALAAIAYEVVRSRFVAAQARARQASRALELAEARAATEAERVAARAAFDRATAASLAAIREYEQARARRAALRDGLTAPDPPPTAGELDARAARMRL